PGKCLGCPSELDLAPRDAQEVAIGNHRCNRREREGQVIRQPFRSPLLGCCQGFRPIPPSLFDEGERVEAMVAVVFIRRSHEVARARGGGFEIAQSLELRYLEKESDRALLRPFATEAFEARERAVV